MRTLISNPTIVNNGEKFVGSIVVNDGRIVEILRGDELPRAECDKIIEATGLYLIPGVIDDHVHIHLVPMQSEKDMLFTNPKLKLTPEEFAEIAEKTVSEIA